MLRRTGTSLIEVIISLTLAAILLATATGSLLRQQRTTTAMRLAGDASAQLRMGTALLSSQLALNDPGADDLVRGELRDTAMQLRVTIATAVACDSSLLPSLAVDADSLPGAGMASPPRRGDSLWWYGADSARWVGREIGDPGTGQGSCAAASPDGAAAPRRVLRLPIAGGDVVPRLAPLRVTRQVRFVVYRSGDGTWQLGLREWSDASRSMGSPQPVAGPFQHVAADGVHTGFRYFDSTETELHPEAEPDAAGRVARIRFTAVALSSSGPGAPPTSARDSVDVVIRPHSPH